jgi:hypothetical protein
MDRAGTESPVPELVARVYAESPWPVRSKLVGRLLAAVGPLAMAAIAGGSFARYLLRSSSSALVVSVEEAQRFSEAQVLELARYVWQASPAAFASVVELLQVENPMLARSLAGGLLLLTLTAWLKGKRRPG